MADITQPISAKVTRGVGVPFRSARYRIKSVRETVERHNISAIEVPEYSLMSPIKIQIQGEKEQDRDMVRRGYSMANNIRESQPIMHRTTKDWSYTLTKTTNLAAPTYMQSVNDMLSLHKTTREIDGELWRDRSRIELPVLENLDGLQSQFTVLDPIRTQIEYVQNYINETAAVMKDCQSHLACTADTIKTIQPKILAQLDDIKHHSLNKLSVLKTLLQRDGVRHNQSQMQVKTQLTALRTSLADYKHNFDGTLSHIQDLQQVVFKTMPFELVEDTSFPLVEPFQQKLF